MRCGKVLAGWGMVLACSGFIAPFVHAHPLDATERVTAPESRVELDRGFPATGLNATIIGIPVDSKGTVVLEAMIYKPDGHGPFPMIVFNHGKFKGDPRAQARSEPVPLAREFVRRGYVVVAPNRRGFSRSGGTYEGFGCDVTRNGMGQAADVAATVDFMSKQSYVDAQHVVVAGVSHGGLATMAYGTAAAPGVRGLINFSGGLRQDACTGWQDNLARAFGTYGEKARVPSLWLYGANDSIWPATLTAKMYAAYASKGASAQMVDFGAYKNDAHRLVGDREGVRVWWPSVEAFLARVGMPTRVQYRVDDLERPKATGYAAIGSVEAVPFLDESGRNGYRMFLQQHPGRAFAISASGAWSWAEGGDDPMSVAVANCQKQSFDPCRLYAVDNSVVWTNPTRTASNTVDWTANSKARLDEGF
ncbi:hypothetical protein CR51_39110 [Caballeronia megalochromosomata]|jgi:dienelactone hydrolase|nr:hypothetical protein CR51_39110 [Caballeronia megalochromosomata]